MALIAPLTGMLGTVLGLTEMFKEIGGNEQAVSSVELSAQCSNRW